MTIFQDKLLKRTHCVEAGDYTVPNLLSARDLVFRPETVPPPNRQLHVTMTYT